MATTFGVQETGGLDFGLACANQLWLGSKTLPAPLCRVFVCPSNTGGQMPICFLANPFRSPLLKLVMFFLGRPIPNSWKPVFTRKNSRHLMVLKKGKRALYTNTGFCPLFLNVCRRALLCAQFLGSNRRRKTQHQVDRLSAFDLQIGGRRLSCPAAPSRSGAWQRGRKNFAGLVWDPKGDTGGRGLGWFAGLRLFLHGPKDRCR